MIRTAVIDYGMSNLGSVCRALEECGALVRVCASPEDLDGETRLVLPGVGSFADGMINLRHRGWVEALPEIMRSEESVLLGICLGMQLLAEKGIEGGECDGLGLIPGQVLRLLPKCEGERVPHVGWNEVHTLRETPLLQGIPDGTDFYFVHSYHFSVSGDAGAAETPFAGGFVSVVARDNVFGTQFHPEKSSRPGFLLLKNFLSSSCCHAES